LRLYNTLYADIQQETELAYSTQLLLYAQDKEIRTNCKTSSRKQNWPILHNSRCMHTIRKQDFPVKARYINSTDMHVSTK